jgi:hypothetical protein
MPLKFKYATKQEIPNEQLSLYIERDGAWLLDADGVVDKAKLDEFRVSNVNLLKERNDLQKRFEGIDPDEARRLAEENATLRTATLSADAKREMEAQLKTAKAGFDKQLAAATGERDALNARLTAIQIDQAVVTEATKRGLRPTAMPDITSRARSAFKLVNGVPQAFEGDGQTARLGKDGPMTLAEWVDALVSDAPHLFEANAGGGAAGSGSGGAGNRSVKNPFRKESFNFTEQMKLQKSDPQLAARLKAAA